MKPLPLKLEGTKMFVLKSFFKLISVRSASILIICLCIGFLSGCSGESNISGGTTNFSGWELPEADTLEWVAPEDVGWSSVELQDAHAFAIQSDCLAVMALYDGKVF